MLFKTIMDNNRFEEEMKGKKAEQAQIDETRSKMHLNPKLRLLQSCFAVNDWETADEICNSIYAGRLDLTLSKDALGQVFKAINWFVEPIYEKASVQNAWGPKKKPLEYMEDELEASIHQADTAD